MHFIGLSMRNVPAGKATQLDFEGTYSCRDNLFSILESKSTVNCVQSSIAYKRSALAYNFRLTQTVPHMQFGTGGDNGEDSVQHLTYPGRKGTNSVLWSGNANAAAFTTRRPQVRALPPQPEKHLISCEIRRFSLLFNDLKMDVRRNILYPALWNIWKGNVQ